MWSDANYNRLLLISGKPPVPTNHPSSQYFSCSKRKESEGYIFIPPNKAKLLWLITRIHQHYNSRPTTITCGNIANCCIIWRITDHLMLCTLIESYSLITKEETTILRVLSDTHSQTQKNHPNLWIKLERNSTLEIPFQIFPCSWN